MDYLIPSAPDLPQMELSSIETPSPYNELGIKGVAELGAVGPTAAIANAVCNALREFHMEINSTPITPEKLWSLLSAKSIENTK